MKVEQTYLDASNSLSSIVTWSLLSIAVVTTLSLATIAIFPGLNGKRRNLIAFFVAFSVGCLLGDVAFHLLPEMSGILPENGSVASSLGISFFFLLGIYLFFAMEKYLQTFHHGHEHSNRTEFCLESTKTCNNNLSGDYQRISSQTTPSEHPFGGSSNASQDNFYSLAGVNATNSLKYFRHVCSTEIQPSCITSQCNSCLENPLVYSVVAGDFLHNFIDGIAIGASFLTSLRTGITTTVAILFHEIPHELSDYAVLIGSGISNGRAFWYCCISNLSAFVGIIPALLLGKNDLWKQYVLSFTAGVFLYVAMADLIPELLYKHSHGPKLNNQSDEATTDGTASTKLKETLLQHFGIIMGCGLMVSIRFFE